MPGPLGMILAVLIIVVCFGGGFFFFFKKGGPSDGSDKMGAQPHMNDGSDKMGAQPHMNDGSSQGIDFRMKGSPNSSTQFIKYESNQGEPGAVGGGEEL